VPSGKKTRSEKITLHEVQQEAMKTSPVLSIYAAADTAHSSSLMRLVAYTHVHNWDEARKII
jgi:hypothetical protein